MPEENVSIVSKIEEMSRDTAQRLRLPEGVVRLLLYTGAAISGAYYTERLQQSNHDFERVADIARNAIEERNKNWELNRPSLG